MWAARSGHIAVVNALLAAPGIDVNVEANDGWTALFGASRFGWTEVVNALLAVPGINLNARDTIYKDSALICATKFRHTGVVQALLDAPHIDVSATDNNGNTALDIATRNGDKEIVELIHNYQVKYEATKKIAKFAKTNFEHAKWRGPDPDTGRPGGWGFRKVDEK